MSNRIRVNIVLFALYAIIAVGVLVAALLLPGIRAFAYAPLRELLIPEPAPIVVELLYSTEKEAWLNEIIDRFEAEDPRIDGRAIELETTAMGSREMYLAVLRGDEQPVVMSPASSLQISLLEDLSVQRFGSPYVIASDETQCRPTVTSPLVLVAWADRADALWGANPGSELWRDLHEALTNPEGWAAYGQPDWGFVKFGHTDPSSSNSGLHTILLLTYNYHGKINGLTAADILSDEGYQEWFLEFEGAISEFGNSTGTYMDEIVAFGPSLYDFVAVYESIAIEQAENAANRYGELRVYYPPATLLSDHPFCVLDAEWVDPLEAQAGQIFIDYLLRPESQELALLEYGFRPAEPGIALTQPGSPFLAYEQNGIRLDLPPEVDVPPGSVLDTLIEFWSRNIGG